MSILDKVKGDATLDTTLTIKISKEQKREVLQFVKKHKLSAGKLGRAGLTMIMEHIEKELEEK